MRAIGMGFWPLRAEFDADHRADIKLGMFLPSQRNFRRAVDCGDDDVLFPEFEYLPENGDVVLDARYLTGILEASFANGQCGDS
jgi:hypothetical protein